MKILAPLNDINNVFRFSEAGADEFYIGFHDEAWIRSFGESIDINRMSGFGFLANRYSLKDIHDIAICVKDCGKKIYVTLNANTYNNSALQFIESRYFPVLKDICIDGIIVSDFRLASLASQNGIPVAISTMGAAYNCDIVREYVALGVKRIIIPRDITTSEIKTIVQSFPQVEFEVFHMRNGCIFSDAFCLGMHRPECGATCGFIRYRDKRIITDLRSFAQKHDIDLNNYLYNTAFHSDACAMCAIYRFASIGVSTLKIVGRADDTDGIFRDIVLTAENIHIAQESTSEEEYLRNMRFPDNAPAKCRLGFSCYYPEVRFGSDENRI